MIEAENLTKVYGDVRAVDDVSFSVGRGEIMGFLGPNGAGKTTTMRMLTCFSPATSGRARIAGHDVGLASFEARRCLGYLPERAPLYDNMKVRGYLMFMAEIKQCPRVERAKFVDQVIDECNLGEVASRLIAHLSKGFRQRVGLAQAILGDPDVLILDEPTAGLDPKQISQVRKLIKAMAGRRTILLSTHILPEVAMTCQKVVVMNRGSIVASGTPQNLVSKFSDECVIEVTIDGDPAGSRERLLKIDGVSKVEETGRSERSAASFAVHCSGKKDLRAEISRAVVDAGWNLIELRSSTHTLEDVFLRVISKTESEQES